MGSSLCKPQRKKIATSSWVANENDNPYEKELTKKERMCLRETYQVRFWVVCIATDYPFPPRLTFEVAKRGLARVLGEV